MTTNDSNHNNKNPPDKGSGGEVAMASQIAENEAILRLLGLRNFGALFAASTGMAQVPNQATASSPATAVTAHHSTAISNSAVGPTRTIQPSLGAVASLPTNLYRPQTVQNTSPTTRTINSNSNSNSTSTMSNSIANAARTRTEKATTKKPSPISYDTSIPLAEAGIMNSKGVVRYLPCRARGMPSDHNFQTAYFEIPEDVKQGLELICSYPQCRNKGIKFLYCKSCKDAIARRSFKPTHLNCGQKAEESPSLTAASASIAPAALQENDESQVSYCQPIKTSQTTGVVSESIRGRFEISGIPSSFGMPTQASTYPDEALTASATYDADENAKKNKKKKNKKRKKSRRSHEDDHDLDNTKKRSRSRRQRAHEEALASNEHDADVGREDHKRKTKKHKKQRNKKRKRQDEKESQGSNDSIETIRKLQWISLLWNRPDIKNAQAMERWIDQVQQCSDRRQPVPEVPVVSIDKMAKTARSSKKHSKKLRTV